MMNNPQDITENTFSYSALKEIRISSHSRDNENYLTQEMLSYPEKIYIITEDYDLRNQTIEIPPNCALKFKGGSLKNGKLIFNNTLIINSIYNIDCDFEGILYNDKVYSSFFKISTTDKTECTQRLQALIDVLKDNSNLFIEGGRTYLLEKNTDLVFDFSKDQPCIFLYNKKNITIDATGVILQVDEHAQGILEIQQCTDIRIIGMPKLIGNLNYVPLDGNTGCGEKGNSLAGYNTRGYWGYYKNNSFDTGFNKFEEGYIGNCGIGILIHNGCNRISISADVSHFNYSGIQIGFYGDIYPTDKEYDSNYDIIIKNCYIHNVYNAGIVINNCKSFIITHNIIEKIGHPNAHIENEFQDPGYGITCNGIRNIIGENGIITQNIVRNCIRKGIDLHAGSEIIIESNKIKDCLIGGIYTAYSSPTQPSKKVQIINNKIFNCGFAPKAAAAIYQQGCIDSNYSIENIHADITIKDNYIKNSSGPNAIIYCRVFKNINIINNIIEHPYEKSNQTIYGILCGRNISDNNRSFNLFISGNKIQCNKNIARGISIGDVENITIRDNEVEVIEEQHSNFNGIRIEYSTNGIINHNNVKMLVNEGRAYSISTLKGDFSNNIATYLTNSLFPHRHIQDIISLTYLFNNQTFNNIINTNIYIEQINSSNYGLIITLKNTTPSQNPVMMFLGLSAPPPSTGGNNVTYCYLRQHSYSIIEIGLKTDITALSNVSANVIVNGTLTITFGL